MNRLAIGVLLGLVAVAPARADATVPGSQTMDSMLDRVQVMPGREYRQITFFPLVLREREESEDVAVDVLRDAAAAGRVTFDEPKWPARRFDVQVRNRGEKPVLVLGGTILEGGRLDRMIPEDVLLPPDSSLELETLPAEYRRDTRDGKEVDPRFRVSEHLAPLYLRKQALFDRDRDLVSRFVSVFLGFRRAGDTRNSLAAVCESPELERGIEAYRKAFSNLPSLYEKRVVGWVVIVGGRVYGLELFGSNRVAAAHFPALLRAHAFPTAAMEVRAEHLGIELPQAGDPDDPERFRPDVDALLDAVRRSERRCGVKPDGTMGSACLLRRNRVRGEALALGDRLLHAGAVADLPFQERLYDRPLPPPPGETPTDPYGALERGANGDIPGRRLTEYEKRLLDRMRERRNR